ncbi:MAG: LysR family transcriptional regulator [Methylobacteriaceae bacterium]|nr:LysR family transcriptional regulator [Methylobacteriaceae bacterium]
MDLRQLRYIVATVEAPSISRAAQLLGMAQPSLSLRLRDIEAELGVRLFHRSTRGVRPTEAALALAARGRSILRQIDGLADVARSVGAQPAGEVTVGLPTTMALHLTLPLVRAVRRDLPQVRLRVSEGMSGHIQEWVSSGRLDLAVLYAADPVAGLEIEPVLNEDLALVTAARSGAGRGGVPLRRLAELRFVLPGPMHGLRQSIERLTAGLGLRLDVAVEIDSLPLLKRLAMDGELATILPRAACLEEIAAGRLTARRIIDPPLSRPIVLAHARDRPLTMAGERVREKLRALVREAVRGRTARGRPAPAD